MKIFLPQIESIQGISSQSVPSNGLYNKNTIVKLIMTKQMATDLMHNLALIDPAKIDISVEKLRLILQEWRLQCQEGEKVVQNAINNQDQD